MGEKYEISISPAGPLVRGDSPEALTRLTTKINKARETASENQLAENTRRAYKAHLTHWTRWTTENRLEPFPASVPMILAYLSDLEPGLARKKGEPGRVSLSTLRARLAAVAYGQAQVGGLPVTRATEVLGLVDALERKYAQPQDQKEPVRHEELFRIVTTLPETWTGHRDRALLLVGFMGGFRRSELSALRVEDVRVVPEGLEVTIWKSKTDQKALGQLVGLAATGTELCPAAALARWLDAAEISSGPVFIRSPGKPALSGHAIGKIVKRHAARLGLDPNRFGGHSLRAGFVTEASRKEWSTTAIANQTRHTNLDTLRGYERRGSLFHNNPSSELALPPSPPKGRR